MDPVVDPANPNPDVTPDPNKSLLDGEAADPKAQGEKSLLDQAAAEAKAAQEAADKKILDTPDEQLDDEGKAKKAELVKAKADADAAKAKADGVPEKYEFKMPEGVKLNQGFVDRITPILKEEKISQKTAQRLADVYIEQQKADAKVSEDAWAKFDEEQRKATLESLGVNYKEEIAYAAKIRDKFLSEKTRELLRASGVDNNKDFISDIIKLGKVISEAKLFDGKPGASGTKSAAETMYPNLK